MICHSHKAFIAVGVRVFAMGRARLGSNGGDHDSYAINGWPNDVVQWSGIAARGRDRWESMDFKRRPQESAVDTSIWLQERPVVPNVASGRVSTSVVVTSCH